MSMFRTVRSLLVLGSLVAAGAAYADADHFNMMNVNDVAKHLGDQSTFVFDANSDKVYAQGHVPGAVHVAFDDFTVAQLPTNKQSNLVFYCKNTQCMASHQAANRAYGMGYQHVYVMPQGIDGWKSSGQPMVTGDQPGAPVKKST